MRIKAFEIIPNGILYRVAVVSGVKLNEFLTEKSIERIELLLGKTTMEQNSDNLSLLGFL